MSNGSPTNQTSNGRRPLDITIMSFGYKTGSPPTANLLFDVRFLKNPFWIEELKPLTGRDKPVQDYVMQQPLAIEFLDSIMQMLDKLLPSLEQQKSNDLIIAFGCTGGQHRSVTLVEALASEMGKRYPHYRLTRHHRELDREPADAVRTPGTAQPAGIIAED